jgi:hypothetical protein
MIRHAFIPLLKLSESSFLSSHGASNIQMQKTGKRVAYRVGQSLPASDLERSAVRGSRWRI